MAPAERSARAFLLRAVDYGESDRILSLLTEDGGKVSAIARGARRSQKRFGGALEPFALIEVALAPSRGSLQRVTEATLLRAHPGLARRLERFGAAAYLIELVRELVAEEEPEPRVFALVDEALALLEEADRAACARLSLAATARALALAGTAISVDRCNACGRPVPPGRRACFDPARGGIVCTACGGGPMVLDAPAAHALAAVAREPLDRIARADHLEPKALVAVERAVDAFVERHVERPLRSATYRAGAAAAAEEPGADRRSSRRRP